MADVGNLSVKITADIADFTGGLSQAASAASSAGSDISSSLQSALSGLTDSITSLGGQFSTLSQNFQNTASSAQASGEQVKAAGDSANNAGGSFGGLSNILEQVKSAFEGLSSETGNVGSLLTGLGSIIGDLLGPVGEVVVSAAAAGAAILEFGNHTAEVSEHLTNLHEQTGISVHDLQAFEMAAQTVGVSSDALAGVITRLQMRLEQLATSSTAPERLVGALHTLGLSLQDLQNPTEALRAVGLRLNDALHGQGDYMQIAGAAAQIFGRNIREIIPALIEYATHQDEINQKVNQYGLTANQIAENDRTAEHVHELGIAWEELRNQLGNAVMPMLDSVVTGLTELMHAAFDVVRSLEVFNDATARLITEFSNWIGATSGVEAANSRVKTSLDGLSLNSLPALIAATEQEVTEIGNFITKAAEWAASIPIVGGAIGWLKGELTSWKDSLINAGAAVGITTKTISDDFTKLKTSAVDTGAAIKKAITDATAAAKADFTGGTTKPGPHSGDVNLPPTADAKRIAQEALAAELAAAQGEAKINEDRLANTKAFYEEQFALGQTSRAQETAQLTDVENQSYQIQHNALERELADLRASSATKPAQIQKVNDQIEELDIASAGRRQAIQAKADEAKYTDLVKTNAIVISEQQSAGDAQVALEEAQTQRQLDLGQITAKQAIQQNIDEEDQKYNVQQNAFEQEFAALEANQSTTDSQYEAFYAKVEAAQQAHEQRKYNLQTKSEQAEQADLNTFLGSVESAYNTVFDTVFNDIGKGWKKLSKDLLGDLEKIGEEILKSGIRDILFGTQGQTGPLAGLVNMLGVGPQGLLGKLFGPLFGVSGAAATGVAGAGTSAVAPAMNIVATKVADMGEAIGTSVTGAGTAAAGAITHAGSVAGNAFTAAGSTVSKGLSDSFGAAAKSAVGPAAGACCDTLSGAASSIKDGSTKIGKAAEPLSSAGDSLGNSANTLNKTVDDFSDPVHTLKTGGAALEHTAQDITGVMPDFKSGSAALGSAADSLSKFSEIIPPLRDATGDLRDTASKLAGTASDLGTLGAGGLPAPAVSTVGGVPVSVGTSGVGFGPIGMPFLPAVPGMIPPGPKPSVEPGALPSGAVGAGPTTITNINNVISTLTGPVTTLLTNAFNAASSVISHVINNAFATNAPVVTTIWNQAFAGALPAVIPLFNSGFGNSVPAIIPLFGSGFNGNQPNVNKLFKNAFDSSQPNINKALQHAIDSSQSTLQKAFQSLLPVFAQAAELFGVVSCALLTECCSCGGGGGGGGGQPGMMGGGGGGGSGGQPSIFPSVGGAIGLAGLLGGLGGGGGAGSLGAFDAAGQGQFPIPLGSASQYSGAQGTGLLGSEGGAGLGSQVGSLATGGLGIAAALGPLIGGALGGQTGSTIGGGIGGATLLGLGLLSGNPLLAIGGGIELLTSLLGIGGGRPTAEATQDIGQFASSSVPSLRQLGKGAQALSAAGIPVSSPQAGPIFGPYFNAARILEDVIRWGPGGLTDTHAQDLDALTLKNAMTEMGNPGHGTATINAIAQAWNNYQAAGGTNAQLTRLTGISGFERGGISPMGGLALLHPNEMVLPSNIADAIKKMAIAPPAAPPVQADNRTPRAYHVHFNINAIDSRGVESWINENQHLIADAVFNSSRQFRNLGIES